MYHMLGLNINVANQLLFVYKRLVSELQVFINPPINTIKATEFIQALEYTQKV